MEVAIEERLNLGLNGYEHQYTPFAQAQIMYLKLIDSLPSSRLDIQDLQMADAVRHMAYRTDGTLVQEILEPDSDRTIGYLPIDPDIEAGLTVVVLSTIEQLNKKIREIGVNPSILVQVEGLGNLALQPR